MHEKQKKHELGHEKAKNMTRKNHEKSMFYEKLKKHGKHFKHVNSCEAFCMICEESCFQKHDFEKNMLALNQKTLKKCLTSCFLKKTWGAIFSFRKKGRK